SNRVPSPPNSSGAVMSSNNHFATGVVPLHKHVGIECDRPSAAARIELREVARSREVIGAPTAAA
ncbi:hypothetical protein ACT3SQ_17585, partial [Brachybacterium sp. AOP42-C2-15]|uniref:hypothetical protein n=1 Tax=Brachybacterium sp. AOP42-C2-15 TaxID=3457670 RepID=UPI0040346873